MHRTAGEETDSEIDLSIDASYLGRVEYGQAWDWQRARFEERLAGRSSDSLMLLEHPPTYTLGRRAAPEDIVYGDDERARRGIALYRVDRGGRATYHGPGQLVGYPIVALGDHYDVLSYLRKLEEGLIRTLAEFGVSGGRDASNTGVWSGPNKIAAIGVRITRGITMHGFALNVTTDLSMFEGIVPCGLSDRGVTSIQSETGGVYELEEVAVVAAKHLAASFGRVLAWRQSEEFHGPDRSSATRAG